MTQKEFYEQADAVIRMDLPDNDPIKGKDRMLGDLLLQAYEAGYGAPQKG